MRCTLAALLVVFAAACDRAEEAPLPPPRVAVCGEAIARAVAALGLGPRVVAADSASRSLAGFATAADLGRDCDRVVDLASGLGLEAVVFDRGDGVPIRALDAAGIRTRVVAPLSLNEVLGANLQLGALLGAESRALTRNAEIARGTSDVARRRDGATRLHVAWVLSQPAPGEWEVVGGVGALHELLELAGAENAFHTPPVASRRVTREELGGADLVLDGSPGAPPDIVVEVRSIPAELGRLPILDPLRRLEPLYRLIYPEAE